MVSQEYIEEKKSIVLNYLENHPLLTAREIGRGCSQRHSVVMQILDELLKEDKIEEIRFIGLKIRSERKTDTRSYYVKPDSSNIEKIFLKIISSKKIEINRFKKIEYLESDNWTFSTLLKNSISTFHEEFKVFRLEKKRKMKKGKNVLSEKLLMNKFHKKFIRSCIIPDSPYEEEYDPMTHYEFIFAERYGFAKNLRLKFLKLRKTSSERLLRIMEKKHETGDYRHAADDIGLSNKQTKRLLAKITDDNEKIDFRKFMRYQEEERIWINSQFDQKTYDALLNSGATKENILDYVYSSGTHYYSQSEKDRKILERKVSQDIKDASKDLEKKRKMNAKN